MIGIEFRLTWLTLATARKTCQPFLTMNSNGIVHLEPVGDIELWAAQPADCEWCLPLHVEWKENPSTKERFGLVLTPFCFYEVQLVALHRMLQHLAEDVDTGQINGWVLREEHVKAVLTKLPGIHAEFYYDWGDTATPPPSPHRTRTLDPTRRPPPKRNEAHRDFASFVSAERHLPEDVVLIVLTAIGQLGSRWLLEYRNTLDLGFVKLVALPFRANWKEVLLWKCKPWKVLRVLRQPAAERDRLLRECKFPNSVCSEHNIGMKIVAGRQRIQYTIEAMATAAFELAADEAESDRMKAGPTSYVQEFEEGVEELYERIVEIMAAHAKKIMAPWATVRSLGASGILAFLPVGRYAHKVRGVSLADLPAHIVPPHSDFSIFGESERKSDPHLVHAQATEVPQVPPFPPAPDNLREWRERRDMEEPRS